MVCGCRGFGEDLSNLWRGHAEGELYVLGDGIDAGNAGGGC